VFGAAAGAFAIGVQIFLTGWLIGHMAGPVSQADAAIICSHNPAAPSASGGSGAPAPAAHKGCCGGCCCPQLAKLLAPPPTPLRLVVLRPHSHTLHADLSVVTAKAQSPAPYASRAPPISA